MFNLKLIFFEIMAKITKCYNYRNKLNAEGKAQIVIRISVGKEKKYFNTGYWIEPHFWDEKKAEVKKTYPNFQKINQRLNGKVAEFQQKEIELINTGKPYSVKDFFETPKEKQNFVDWCETVITERRNTVSDKHKSLYRKVIGEVIALKKTENFKIKDLDLDFLYQYQIFLLKKDLDPKTINKRLQMLAMFVNEAIKTGLLKPSENCFLDYKYLKETDKERFMPSKEEVEKLESLDLSYNKELELVRDLFVFNCYVGMRNEDLFSLSYDNLSVENGETILHFVEHKTQKQNIKNVSILGYGKGMKFLEKYKGQDENLLFPRLPDTKIRKHVETLRTVINARLPFTFYGSRHFCLSDLASRGLPINDLQYFAKHSDIRTTQYYLHSQTMDTKLRQIFTKN